MGLKNYNIGVKEAVHRVRRIRRPLLTGADLYQATGDTLERRWSGPWAELEEMMESLEYSEDNRLDATLTRVADGEQSELVATWTDYRLRDAGGSGSGEDAAPGSSREAPAVSVQVTVTEEPLLTHPNYNFLTGDYLTALKMLMDGYKESDVMTDSRTGEPITLKQLLSEVDTGDDKLVERVKKGQTHYMAPAVQVTCRYRANSMPQLATSLKVGQPPAGIPTPTGHNWLALVPGVDVQNGEIWVSETYLLSAPGGWDETIYGAAT